MSTVIKFSASVSPPDSIKEYGSGDFLVGFWGQPIQYTKDAQLWYEHPKHFDWQKGNYAELDDITANDNNKTFDFSSTPIFISSLAIRYDTTATTGTRIFRVEIQGTNNAMNISDLPLVASKYAYIYFEQLNQDDLSFIGYDYHLVFPKFWNENIPFWNKIQILVGGGNVDSNDDMTVFLKGVYALPKYHWIELKNCKNFQVRKVTETLSDGIFSGVTLGPRSLKVLKI